MQMISPLLVSGALLKIQPLVVLSTINDHRWNRWVAQDSCRALISVPVQQTCRRTGFPSSNRQLLQPLWRNTWTLRFLSMTAAYYSTILHNRSFPNTHLSSIPTRQHRPRPTKPKCINSSTTPTQWTRPCRWWYCRARITTRCLTRASWAITRAGSLGNNRWFRAVGSMRRHGVNTRSRNLMSGCYHSLGLRVSSRTTARRHSMRITEDALY